MLEILLCSGRFQWPGAAADLGRGAERSLLMSSGIGSDKQRSGCMPAQTASNMGLPYTLASFLNVQTVPIFHIASGRFSRWSINWSLSCK